MARYGSFQVPIQLTEKEPTAKTPEYRECMDRVVAARARWHERESREIRIAPNPDGDTWRVEVGYVVGPEYHTYRVIHCKTYADAEKVAQNHVKRYRGMVTVAGFELPKEEK